jgi:hypothetical protein
MRLPGGIGMIHAAMNVIAKSAPYLYRRMSGSMAWMIVGMLAAQIIFDHELYESDEVLFVHIAIFGQTTHLKVWIPHISDTESCLK